MLLLNRYEYDPQKDLIGQGGFSDVYKAIDTRFNRTVALKFFKGNESAEKYSLSAEIKRVIDLEHPNICRYYDVEEIFQTHVSGRKEKTEIAILDFIDGGSLGAYFKNHSDADTRKKLLVEVLQGLAYLHENDIIHRDIKPDNILIKETKKGPVAKIVDFGISKNIASSTGQSSSILGSIEYMAPEQFNTAKYGINNNITTNLDLWAYGIMLYELLYGYTPFGSRGIGDNTEQVMHKILWEEVKYKNIAIPHPYRKLMERCLVKNANVRVQMADELITILAADQPNQASYVQKKTNDIKTSIIRSEKVNSENIICANYTQLLDFLLSTSRVKDETPIHYIILEMLEGGFMLAPGTRALGIFLLNSKETEFICHDLQTRCNVFLITRSSGYTYYMAYKMGIENDFGEGEIYITITIACYRGLYEYRMTINEGAIAETREKRMFDTPDTLLVFLSLIRERNNVEYPIVLGTHNLPSTLIQECTSRLNPSRQYFMYEEDLILGGQYLSNLLSGKNPGSDLLLIDMANDIEIQVNSETCILKEQTIPTKKYFWYFSKEKPTGKTFLISEKFMHKKVALHQLEVQLENIKEHKWTINDLEERKNNKMFYVVSTNGTILTAEAAVVTDVSADKKFISFNNGQSFVPAEWVMVRDDFDNYFQCLSAFWIVICCVEVDTSLKVKAMLEDSAKHSGL